MIDAALSDAVCPPADPLVSGLLDVSQGHHVYHEQWGNTTGLPVIFLHGGPGGGCSPRHRELFDLTRHRVTFFDQRGCGRSLPRGEVRANTSDLLVADIEQLRQHLGIGRWLVFGGSWGAGLALAYAAAHPASCLGLVLRGVFLGRTSDIDWFFKHARQFLPDAWAELARPAPEAARADLLAWLHSGLHGGDREVALLRAMAWETWEASVSLRRSAEPRRVLPAGDEGGALLDKYRVQSHYLAHGCFWETSALLSRAQSLARVPAAILHGRLDWVCRPQAAWDLHRCLPGSRLQWLEDCGHSPFEPPMAQALAQALGHFSANESFAGWGQSFSEASGAA